MFKKRLRFRKNKKALPALSGTGKALHKKKEKNRGSSFSQW